MFATNKNVKKRSKLLKNLKGKKITANNIALKWWNIKEP